MKKLSLVAPLNEHLIGLKKKKENLITRNRKKNQKKNYFLRANSLETLSTVFVEADLLVPKSVSLTFT
jgi:hypothetical protein